MATTQQLDLLNPQSAWAWEEGLSLLDCFGGREALKQKLSELTCLERPFLTIYWQSEAFLEIARPLLKLEEMMEGLAEIELISKLYNTLKATLGGQRDWSYYICPTTNAPAYYRLLKERITTYPITVQGNDFEKEYVFLPGISGILTIAMYGVRLRLPDNEDFLIF